LELQQRAKIYKLLVTSYIARAFNCELQSSAHWTWD